MFGTRIVFPDLERQLYGVPYGERRDHGADADGPVQGPAEGQESDLHRAPDDSDRIIDLAHHPQHETVHGARPQPDPQVEIQPCADEPDPEGEQQQLPEEVRGFGDDPQGQDDVYEEARKEYVRERAQAGRETQAPPEEQERQLHHLRHPPDGQWGVHGDPDAEHSAWVHPEA